MRVAVLVGLSWLLAGSTHGQTLGVSDVDEFQGTITNIKFTRAGKMRIEVRTGKEGGKDKIQEFVADWKTLFYQLSKRNVELFKEEEHFQDVLDQVNIHRKTVDELPAQELRLLMSQRAAELARQTPHPDWSGLDRDIQAADRNVQKQAAGLGEFQLRWTREEEERRRVFGQTVRLTKDMKARFYVGKRVDVSYIILVEEVPEKKRAPAKGPAKEKGSAKEPVSKPVEEKK
jgi:hypothetical protein